jgi:hypothetical protein
MMVATARDNVFVTRPSLPASSRARYLIRDDSGPGRVATPETNVGWWVDASPCMVTLALENLGRSRPIHRVKSGVSVVSPAFQHTLAVHR